MKAASSANALRPGRRSGRGGSSGSGKAAAGLPPGNYTVLVYGRSGELRFDEIALAEGEKRTGVTIDLPAPE